MDGVLTIEIPDRRQDGKGVDGDLAAATAPFVVGPENRLLLAPLERLMDPSEHLSGAASEDAIAFNPLLLVGPSGSGKSTLLRAIVRSWTTVFGADEVRYENMVDFGRDVQSAQASGQFAAWRESLHKVRLLAIDDLQRARRRSTIHFALRNAIDAIIQRGGIAVVASQVLPASLLQLDAGLRDRLGAGLTIQIQWPAAAARRELLRSAFLAQNVVIDAAQLERLAASLEGSAASVVGAVAELDCGDVGKRSNDDLTAKRIATVVGRYLGVSKSEMLGKSRRKSLVYARSITAHLARRFTNASYAQIGSDLGGRDHTTIMHADRSIAHQAANDPVTQHTLEELARILPFQ